MKNIFAVAVIVAGTLCVLPSPAQADREDHSNHDEGGSQGGNGNPVDSFYDACKQGKASCVGAVKSKEGSTKSSDCYKTESCDFLVAISKEKENKYKFSLFGKQKAPGYVAVGISEDGKAMAKTSIVECRAPPSGQGQIVPSWSDSESKPKILEEGKGKFIKPIENPYIYDGKIFCEFYRETKSNVEGYDFDLDNGKYRVLLAIGGINNDGSILYHGEGSRVLSDYMNLKSANATPTMLPTALLVFLSIFIALF